MKQERGYKQYIKKHLIKYNYGCLHLKSVSIKYNYILLYVYNFGKKLSDKHLNRKYIKKLYFICFCK